MGITVDNTANRMHLFTDNTSYIIEIYHGELLHSYWGKKIKPPAHTPLVPLEAYNSFSPNPEKTNPTYSLDLVPREFPDYGRSDYRLPAYQLMLSSGSTLTKFVFREAKVYKEKFEIPNLPATYQENDGEFETLEILLHDEISSLELRLFYCVSEKYDAITRFCRIQNLGSEEVYIEKLLSASVDFYNDNDFDFINLYGSWARERHICRQDVGHSTHILDSKRGASGHQQNPLVMLCRKNSTEHSSEVYAMNLVYSGSFTGSVEVSPYNSTRMQLGINDFGFRWCLKPQEMFYTPEAVMVYSDKGFNGLSGIFHRLYRERLVKSAFRDKVRPILINNWEATYFNFDEVKLLEIGTAAQEVGIELFVLDDGWFGVRNADNCSLGDWKVNKDKLPNGLLGFGKKLNEKGLIFGLWFEPEMISPNSNLYREHPDWCIHVDGHTRSEGRSQLILDLANAAVQDFLIETIGNILENNPIGYVKWDMNRNMTEIGSPVLSPKQQGEVMHRYILGLYRVLNTLTTKYCDILFESCSGGGGRFDAGMLYYMPQVWTSDDTDAYERLFIQYGTSLVYPQITMGAHISSVPNHQAGRSTPLKTRALVAMTGNFGYELDLSKLSQEERDEIKSHIRFYKKERENLQFGRVYRLLSPFEDGKMAQLIEAPDKSTYFLFIFYGVKKPNHTSQRLPLIYLDAGEYSVESFDFYEIKESTATYDSSFLNAFGFQLPPQRMDFDSHLVVYRKLNKSGSK